MDALKAISALPESILSAVPAKYQIPALVGTSLAFFLAILFLSSRSVKEVYDRVPSRARTIDEDEDAATPKKALFDSSDEEGDTKTPKKKRTPKQPLGSLNTPAGRRSQRIQTAEKKKKTKDT